MKVDLVSYSDGLGGAGRAARRVFDALVRAGTDARLIVDVVAKGGPGVSSSVALERAQRSSMLRARLGAAPLRLQQPCDGMFRTTGLVPGPAGRAIHQSDADVVNVHWISAGTLSVRQVVGLQKPVVLTMHDMWWFCGAEHHAPDRESARWRTGYSRDNRAMGSTGLDIDRRVWQRKRRILPATGYAIAPSDWLRRCAEESKLMRGWDIRAVPNPVDLDVFVPTERSVARTRLGLDADEPLVLFASHQAVKSQTKGFDLLVRAMARLVAVRPDVRLVIAGDRGVEHLLPRGLRFAELGLLEDEDLALAYSAADVVAVPSRQENLPQVSTEAQSCGAPVVVFDACGQAETVQHQVTGMRARAYDAEDFADALLWVLEDESRSAALRRDARRRAERLWAPEVVSQKYLTVLDRARLTGRT